MSLRTLKFGDRTISYDTGLQLVGMHADEDKHEDSSPSSVVDQADDGIGSSDDETNSSKEDSSTCSSEETIEDERCSPFESDSSPNLSRSSRTSAAAAAARRLIIKPDPKLLDFDEEEEDELDDDSEEEDDTEKRRCPGGWQKTIVKDLANSTSPRSMLKRRHSITLCESRRKTSTSSTSSTSSSSSTSSPPRPLSPKQSSGPRSLASHPPPYSLNVSQMHSKLQDEFDETQSRAQLKTLNLRLDEVAHIRSVLTKAELEGLPLDGNVRSDVEKGKVCFLCMRTKFGLFSRGLKCEMCKQIVCSRCHAKMRIPLEHFSNIPVFALSPTSNPVEPAISTHGLSPHTTVKEKKLSLPDSLGLNSAGSAPNSPQMARRDLFELAPPVQQSMSMVPTISAAVNGDVGPMSLPPVTKYATLPKKNRRMSWMGMSRDAEREKLEGVPLTVCNDCKEMTLQVIRASRTTRRMHMVRSMFLSSTPDTVRENRL